MTVCHHLNDATLMRFASGDLDEAFSVVVASHISICQHCRENLLTAEEIGGQILQDADQIELSPDAFEKILERLDHPPYEKAETQIPASQKTVDPSENSAALPAPLAKVLARPLEDIPWKLIAPGVRKHDLPLSSETQSSLYMLNISPGKTVPEHGHGGAEITLILSGAYRDNLGRFAAGDIADLDEHLEHQPKVEADAPCICLVATEAPTKFKGFISQLLQPLTGI